MKNNMKRVVFVGLLGLIVLGCFATGPKGTPPGPQPAAKTSSAPGGGDPTSSAFASQIKNMQIQLVAQDSHPTVQLTDGKYRRTSDPTAPDYAEVTLLADSMAFGDLNGDNVPDAAVLVAENYGGTGTFVSVIAMINSGGKPAQAGAYMVDDRPIISSLSIVDSRVILEARIHGPTDPGCCASFAVVDTFALTRSGLTLQRMVSKTADGNLRTIIIESPADGVDIATALIQVKGSFSIAPFENTLSYHVYDPKRTELASGSFPVSAGAGLAGTFDAPINLSAVPSGTLIRLEIRDVSAADGSTLAMDSIQLMIK